MTLIDVVLMGLGIAVIFVVAWLSSQVGGEWRRIGQEWRDIRDAWDGIREDWAELDERRELDRRGF